MAVLDATQRAAVWAKIQEDFSADGTEIPVTKTEGQAIVDAADAELETAESSSLAALAGTASTWMTANPGLLRQFIEETQAKRREVL